MGREPDIWYVLLSVLSFAPFLVQTPSPSQKLPYGPVPLLA
jgi:hypothetical protein